MVSVTLTSYTMAAGVSAVADHSSERGHTIFLLGNKMVGLAVGTANVTEWGPTLEVYLKEGGEGFWAAGGLALWSKTFNMDCSCISDAIGNARINQETGVGGVT